MTEAQEVRARAKALRERREELEQWGLPPGIEVLTSSDAHCMEKVAGRLRELPEGSVLEKLL